MVILALWIQTRFQKKQKLKKKKENKKELPALDVSKLPAPHEIKRKLDEYVIGQTMLRR